MINQIKGDAGDQNIVFGLKRHRMRREKNIDRQNWIDDNLDRCHQDRDANNHIGKRHSKKKLKSELLCIHCLTAHASIVIYHITSTCTKAHIRIMSTNDVSDRK